MKYILILMICLNLYGRTCDEVWEYNDKLYMALVDPYNITFQSITRDEIKKLYFYKLQHNELSINLDNIICEIIEEDVETFKDWYFK